MRTKASPLSADTLDAKAILDALYRKRPQDTFELKLNTSLARPKQRRAFDAAMAEVQRQLLVSMREVRYEPAFTYVWDLVEARFPAPVAAARRRPVRDAARAVAERYLQSVIYATMPDIVGVLGERHRAESAVADLARQGVVEVDCRIDGLQGKWLVTSGALRRCSGRW
jgi:hypothetical protein